MVPAARQQQSGQRNRAQQPQGSVEQEIGADDQFPALCSMQRAVVGMIAKLRFGNEPSLPSWKSRHDFHRLHQRRGIVGMGKPLHRHHLVAGSDGDVKIIVLEEKTLAGIAGRKGKPQAIPAIGPDARGTEPVAIGLDMDVPRLGSLRQDTGDPGGDGRTRDENRQRQKAADRKIARIPRPGVVPFRGERSRGFRGWERDRSPGFMLTDDAPLS